MKVVIVGYGRMGREIESILVERGHEVALRVDASGNADTATLDTKALATADGVIEFALPEGILDRMAVYADAGKPAVIGTTGWNGEIDTAREMIQDSGTAVLVGSNFSVGAHLFFRLSKMAATLIDNVEEYDASLVEYHHNKKADYPSGTALTAAKGVLDSLKRKTHIISELPNGPIPPEALQVASVRVGSVPGVHELQLDSAADYLTIRHEARGRRGLALGAVRGMEWLSTKKGWYDADTFFDDLLSGGKT